MKPTAVSVLLATAALAAGCARPPPRAVTSEEAVAAVLAGRPDLKTAVAASLPPTEVETAAGPAGARRVGVVTSGSGVPWILRAECFSVSPAGAVRPAGTYRHPAGGPGARRLRLEDCTPER